MRRPLECSIQSISRTPAPGDFAEGSSCCFSQSASVSTEIASSFFFLSPALIPESSLSVSLRKSAYTTLQNGVYPVPTGPDGTSGEED
jgi:hypothetical protein